MKRVPWWVVAVLAVLAAILAFGFASLSGSGVPVTAVAPRAESEPVQRLPPPPFVPAPAPPEVAALPAPTTPPPPAPPAPPAERPRPQAPSVEISIDGPEDAEFAALAPRMATCLSDAANVSPGPRKLTITFMRRGNLFEEGQLKESSNPDPFAENCILDVLKETDTPVAGGLGPPETQNATLVFDPEKHRLEIHRF